MTTIGTFGDGSRLLAGNPIPLYYPHPRAHRSAPGAAHPEGSCQPFANHVAAPHWTTATCSKGSMPQASRSWSHRPRSLARPDLPRPCEHASGPWFSVLRAQVLAVDFSLMHMLEAGGVRLNLRNGKECSPSLQAMGAVALMTGATGRQVRNRRVIGTGQSSNNRCGSKIGTGANRQAGSVCR